MPLTQADREYAIANKISFADMRAFREDQIREEEIMRSFLIQEEIARGIDCLEDSLFWRYMHNPE